MTSPGLEVYAGFGADTTGALQASFEQVISLLVDHLEYLNAGNRGYMLVTFTQESATCEWNFVDTIASTDYGALSAQAKTLQDAITCIEDWEAQVRLLSDENQTPFWHDAMRMTIVTEH